jgi:hypothetical protein
LLLADLSVVQGQRDLSLRDDFNWQWPETARVATLSQRIASKAPTGFFR